MATTETPRVSVIIPTHNRAKLLGRALQSVRAQTFTDWECIVVDDSSVDETPKVISEFTARDSRFRMIRIDRGHEQYPGIYSLLNKGLLLARGEYIARLDDDDEWIHPDKLKLQVEFLETHPDYGVVGGGMVVRDENGVEKFRYYKPEHDFEIRKSALVANPLQHPTVMIRASALRQAGGYPVQRYAEDWALWLYLGKKWKLHNLREYFTAYNQTEKNWSYRAARAQSRTILGMISKYRGIYPNYFRGVLVNGAQFLFVLLPVFLRRPVYGVLSRLKRVFF